MLSISSCVFCVIDVVIASCLVHVRTLSVCHEGVGVTTTAK